MLHSRLMFRTFEKRSRSKPFMLVGYDSDGSEIGHLLVTKKRSICLLPPMMSTAQYTIHGEGVYRHGEEREKLFTRFLEHILSMPGSNHTLIKVRNIEDSRFAYNTLRTHNFIPLRDQRLYISLHSKPPKERLTRAYKAHIRKAEANGVSGRRATSPQEIAEGINLLHNYYISKTRRLPCKKALHTMLHNNDGTLSNEAKMFIVEYKGKIIGSSICLYEEGRASLAFSCGLRKRHPLQYPGIMAIWTAITDAHQGGYDHFEFLEARLLPYMHRKFIATLLNYGGKIVGTLRWYRFRWEWMNKILRAIYV